MIRKERNIAVMEILNGVRVSDKTRITRATTKMVVRVALIVAILLICTTFTFVYFDHRYPKPRCGAGEAVVYTGSDGSWMSCIPIRTIMEGQ